MQPSVGSQEESNAYDLLSIGIYFETSPYETMHFSYSILVTKYLRMEGGCTLITHICTYFCTPSMSA
jgi:hypothetical protein